MLKQFWWGVRALFQKKHWDREIDAEVEAYIEAAAEEKMRTGMGRQEALRRARLELGGAERIKDEVRSVGWEAIAEELLKDAAYALRSLRRNPTFSVVAIVALTLGIGANTAVFTVVRGVLLRPLSFPEPHRLMLACYYTPSTFVREPSMSDRDYLAYAEQQRSFETVGTFNSDQTTVTDRQEPMRLASADVSPSFFKVLGVNPELGRRFLDTEDEPGHDHVVILSHRLSIRIFHGTDVALGRTIKLDGVPHTIVGIMPSSFSFPSEAELWTPMRPEINPHRSRMRPVIGRLRAAANRAQAQAELEAIAPGLPTQPKEGIEAAILPLKELLVSDARRSLLMFSGAVALVLLIACANVANLLLMRASGRRQEMAVRVALGATRGRLVRQLLTESSIIALIGGALGLLLAAWGVPLLLALAPTHQIPRMAEVRLDYSVLFFTFGGALGCGLLFGLAPAFNATQSELRGSTTQLETPIAGRPALRSMLVVAEIGLAMVLLTGAGLMVKSFVLLRRVDPGFRPDNILTFTVDLPESFYSSASSMRNFHREMLEQLSSLPKVESVAAVNFRPLGGALVRGDFVLERQGEFPPGFMVDKMVVSPGYFRTLGIALLSGRDFEPRDGAGAPAVVIVSKSTAQRLWPGQDPIGERISMQDKPKEGDWLTIIGVVDDVRQQSLAKGSDPATYQPYAQVGQSFFLGHMTYALRTGASPETLAAGMRDVLHRVDPDLPPQDISTIRQWLAATIAEPLFQARLLSGFSLLALLLAAIGIYGVMACAASERTREIGVRMALGARAADVLAMMMRSAGLLALCGLATGTLGAYLATRVLRRFLFGVTPTDGPTFLVGALALGAVTLIAALVPARRAAHADPLVALRYE